MSVKLCKDCKFFIDADRVPECYCGLPSACVIDPVYGVQRRNNCGEERKTGLCGKEGRFWEARDEQR